MCELPYVFGYPLLQNNPMVRRDTKIIDIIRWNDEDIAYARYFMPMLTNFAKYRWVRLSLQRNAILRLLTVT